MCSDIPEKKILMIEMPHPTTYFCKTAYSHRKSYSTTKSLTFFDTGIFIGILRSKIPTPMGPPPPKNSDLEARRLAQPKSIESLALFVRAPRYARKSIHPLFFWFLVEVEVVKAYIIIYKWWIYNEIWQWINAFCGILHRFRVFLVFFLYTV